MGQITSEEEFDKAMLEHAIPIVEQTFTNEDIKALREYLDKLEELNRETPPERITPEEWDEALEEIKKTGEIPAKYAGRIGKKELKGRELPPAQFRRWKTGEQFFAYYDIAYEEYRNQFVRVRDEYQDKIDKVIIAESVGQFTPTKSDGSLIELIKSFLDNPELVRELEKEARRLEKRQLPALGALPNTEPLNLLYHVMLGSKSGREIKGSRTNRNEHLTAERKTDGSITFTRESKGSIHTIDIKSANLLFENYHKGFTKILTFVLQELSLQGFPHFLGFPLKEMVDIGMYTTTSNAARAVNDFFVKQDNILIGGQERKKRRTISQAKGKLFYNIDISKTGFVTLAVNENLNWEYLASYFTVFPRWAYRLKTNAFAMVRYIFFVARQNGKKIKETGKFSIVLDTMREQIGLPTAEEAGKNPGKLIINPIEDAITEIEDTFRKDNDSKESVFTITPVQIGTTKINEWLQGSLEIEISGKYAETFIQIAAKAARETELWEKAKRTELAKIAAKAEAAKK